jgi:hypothetical protein
VQQVGFIKTEITRRMDSYDTDGNKTAIAVYDKGQKKLGSGFF